MTTTQYVEAFRVGKASPFRSDDQSFREGAADAMLNHRDAEIASIELALKHAKGLAKKNLRLRLQAAKNNAVSWGDYLSEDAPQEKRAVMTPFIRPNPLIVK